MCRFVDVSDGSGWERKKANSSAMYGPEVNANGKPYETISCWIICVVFKKFIYFTIVTIFITMFYHPFYLGS